MATWTKCTTTKGEAIFVNLDDAITLVQRGMREETAISFVGGGETLEVKETPEDLIANSPMGRALRRADFV